MTDFNRVSTLIASRLERIEAIKTDHLDALAKNGWAHTLSWGQTTFEAVAMEEVLRTVQIGLEFYRDGSEEDVCKAADFPYPLTPSYPRFTLFKDWVLSTALNRIATASMNTKSTMPTSNVLNQCLVEAWTKVARNLTEGGGVYL